MPIFDTPAPISATLDLVIGDVRVTAEDRIDTVVEVRPSDTASDNDVRAAEQTRVEFADGRLLVKAPRQRTLGLFGKPGSIEVTVLLPSGSQLRGNAEAAAFHASGRLGECTVKTSVGNIQLEHTGVLDVHTAGVITVGTVDGNAQVSTSTGAIRVGEVAGTASIKNSNGDTQVGAVAGNVTVRAANGHIHVEHAGGDVTATSSNGDIRIGAVTRGSVSMKTANGELEVGIPAGTAAYLDLHTAFGHMHNRLDATGEPADEAEKVEIHARTSFGDIIVRRPTA